MALYDIAAGLKPLDLGQTLGRLDAMQANRLQAEAAQGQLADRRALNAAMAQHGPALFGSDPAARTAAAQALASVPGGQDLAYRILSARTRALTPQEATAAGFRPGTVVSVNDFTGARSVDQQPDAMSGDRFRQERDLRIASHAPVSYQPVTTAAGIRVFNPRTGQFLPGDPTPAPRENPPPGSENEAYVNLQRFRDRPDSPEYAVAYNRIFGDRTQLDANGNATIMTPSGPVGFPRPSYSQQPAPQQFGPRAGAQPPAMGALPPGSLPEGAPGARQPTQTTITGGLPPGPNSPQTRTVETTGPNGGVIRRVEQPTRQQELQAQQSRVEAQNAVALINDVRETMKGAWLPTTGPVALLTSRIPGTAAYNAAQTLQTLETTLAFDRLQQMRAASPTGGALGAVSDRENNMLRAAFRNLAQSQSQDQFDRNLKVVEERFLETIHGPRWREVVASERQQQATRPPLSSFQR